MNLVPLSYVEITDVRDDLLLPWLDLYETAFPASEQVLVSTLLGVLKKRMAGENVQQHLLSALDEEDRPVGMAMYSAPPEAPAANLWYLAVEPRARNNGIGVTIYREILRRIAAPERQVLVYEVEIPDGQDTYAQRRIHFYQRQGAHQLKGIHYMQYVGWHQPPMPMHLMVHLLQLLDAQTVFDLAKGVYGDALEQVGLLELE